MLKFLRSFDRSLRCSFFPTLQPLPRWSHSNLMITTMYWKLSNSTLRPTSKLHNLEIMKIFKFSMSKTEIFFVCMLISQLFPSSPSQRKHHSPSLPITLARHLGVTLVLLLHFNRTGFSSSPFDRTFDFIRVPLFAG